MKSLIVIFSILFVSISTTASLTASPNDENDLTIFLENQTGCVDGTEVCIDITVKNFTDLISFQTGFSFDPTVIEYTRTIPNPVLDGFGIGDLFAKEEGWIILLWTDALVNGITVADNTVIGQICFKVIGEAGSSTDIILSNDFDTFSGKLLDPSTQHPINYNPVTINVTSCNEFDIVTDWCSPTIGKANGTLYLSACCGSSPYFFNIPGLVPAAGSIADDNTTMTINNVAAGTYTAEVRDVNGITKKLTFTIKENIGLEALPLATKDPTCWNKTNGTLTLEGIGGGQAPYSLSWSTGQYKKNVASSDIVKIKSLTAGKYYLTITDKIGCEYILEETLVAPDTIKATAIVIDPTTCEGIDDGKIEITGSGGKLFNGIGYHFNGNNATPPTLSTIISNVSAGWNEYKVSGDPANCYSAIDSIYVPILKELHFKPLIVNDLLCYGDILRVRMEMLNGERISTFTFKKTGPPSTELDDYNAYLYSEGFHGVSDIIQPEVKAGTYHIQAFESATGCTVDTMITINQPDSLYITSDITSPGCFGNNNGQILLTPNGGTPNYSFLWNDNTTTDNKTNIGVGKYSVTLTDDNNCKDSLTVNFDVGDELKISINVLQLIDCTSPNSGSLEAIINSSGSSFSYDWSNTIGSIGSTKIINDLISDTYFLKVTDNIIGCEAFDTITLQSAANIDIDSIITLPSCYYNKDGSIGLNIQGGILPYQIDWKDYPAYKDQQLLPAIGQGTYQVTIRDATNCTIIKNINLPSPDTLKVSIDNIISTNCLGDNSGQATAVGINGNNGANYNFTWSSSPNDGVLNQSTENASHLLGGNQWVYVTDVNCVSDTLFFIVPEPTQIVFTTEITMPDCSSDCNGSLKVIPTGGTPGYNYFWQTTGGNDDNITNLCAGDYSLKIRDANNCIIDTIINLTEPDKLVASINNITTQDISCVDLNSGTISVDVTGGNTGNIIYSWPNNESTTHTATGLSEGRYIITVTDIKGCTDTTKYTLYPPSPVYAVIDTPPVIECYGDETCISIQNATGGVGNYTFSVNNSPNLPIDSCISVYAGEYNILVFDNAGCYDEEDITITQPSKTSLVISPGDELFDLGQDPKILDLIITNNNAPTDNVIWTPETHLECLTDKCTQVAISPISDITYYVVLTDENGCISKTSIDIKVKNNRNVYFPNIFQPQGSSTSTNNLFQFELGAGVHKLDYLQIYDRWGNLIFNKKDVLPANEDSAAWDGRYKGELVKPGVYVYSAAVSFIDGKVIPYKGSITIVR